MSRTAAWAGPFLTFLVVRLFSANTYYLLGGDQCTFLTLGRSFPWHQLYNHDLYLIHPPLFGWVIGTLALALPLLAAGLIATLLFAVVAFFALRALARFDELPPAAVGVALLYLALSRPAVAYDSHVTRVPVLVCGFALAMLAFVHLLRTSSRRALLLAAAANTFCLMTGDQGLLLLPCQAILFVGRVRRPFGWRPILVLAATSLAAAAFWPLVRLVAFSRHEDLPAGIDGTIEITRGFPLRALLQPNFLPFTDAHRSLFTETSLSVMNVEAARLAALPVDLLLLPRWLGASVVGLLVAAALGRPAQRGRVLSWLAVSVLLLWPAGVGMNEWYAMPFVVPFALLLAEGTAALLAGAVRFFAGAERALVLATSAACAVSIASWLRAAPAAGHSPLKPRAGAHFLFARPPVTRAAELARRLPSMPQGAGIMAPVGLVPEIAYLTDKRVVAVPFDPGLLPRFVARYRISYLLLSSEFRGREDAPKRDKYTSARVTRHVFAQPDRYRLVARHQESYPAFYPPLEYYVFETTSLSPETNGASVEEREGR